MRIKSILLMALCVLITLGTAGLTGCGTDDEKAAAEGGAAGNGAEASPDADDEEQVYQVALYFANEEYINTGDESLKKFNILSAEITSTPENVYQDTLEMLKDPSNEGSSTMVTDQVVFNSVYLEGDTVYVDIKSVGPNGGSTGEGFLISQIVDTLLDFDEVAQVQFLVNGEVVESLMGHVGTMEPFTKDVFTE